jgi:hypothetical protein
MTHSVTYSAAIPAVSFQDVTGGVRVRREGKGDTLFATRDSRTHRHESWLLVHQGDGVVGRAVNVDGEWVIERGTFRHWEQVGTPWQVFPSSTVETFGGFGSFEDAVAEEALYWLS